MADPIAVADFWEQLHFAGRSEFVLQHNRKQSMDGDGNVLSATFGVAPKWKVDVALAGGRHNRNLVQEADLAGIGGRDLTFLAYDIRQPWPDFDPGGAKVGDRTVLIKSKGSDNRSFALEGLPRRFTVTKRDMISVVYATDRYFLCRAMESVASDTNGDTAEFQVWPYLPLNLAVGDAVTLVKPPAKFKLVAGSYRPSSGSGNSASGPSFSMISVP